VAVLKKVFRKSNGDTMIEVLFAVTIFSMVAVGGLTIMNQGAASAQRSLEVTLVRQEIDAQAEALRILYEEIITQRITGGAASPEWRDITTGSLSKASASVFPSSMIDATGSCRNPADSGGVGVAFIMSKNATPVKLISGTNGRAASVYSQVRYDASGSNPIAEGIWIEAERHANATGGYTDFHIRACWSTVGQAQPITLGTIVRLYEPAQ